MERRPQPRVAAVEPIAADMVVPLVVLAGDRRSGPYNDDRTAFYLIDGFNALLGRIWRPFRHGHGGCQPWGTCHRTRGRPLTGWRTSMPLPLTSGA